MELTIDNEVLTFPSIRLALAHILFLFRVRKLDSDFKVRLGRSNYLFKVDSEYIYVYKNNKYLNRFPLQVNKLSKK